MTIEHPLPTEATVKFMYAHAFGCAFEGCRRPLYRVDDITGIRTLNSRVCHVHARREGGPRWNPDQSAEDNRSAKNLVLMCVEHAAAIDIPETLSAYPPDRLLQWKQIQLEDYDRIQQGWVLDTEMAQEAITASLSTADVLITHSTVNLGGEGGKASGAGGGGGGAIGRGARGGRGGNGGVHHVDEGEFSIPWPNDSPTNFGTSELAQLGIDFVPGAGGPGAGAIGEGAIGGNGGDGGDSASGIVDIAKLQRAGLHHIECVVGKGGENGGDGGDTIMKFLTEDGTVLKTIRASGGKGGGTKLPEGCAEIGAEDIQSNFRVTTLLAANTIEVRDGLFFLLGGDWGVYAAPHLPFDAVWPVAYSLRWDASQWNQPRVIFLSLVRPDGTDAAHQQLIIPLDSGTGGSYRGCQPISAKLDTEGIWSIQLRAGQFLLAEVPMLVTVPPAPKA